jgi:hypothetical protein
MITLLQNKLRINQIIKLMSNSPVFFIKIYNYITIHTLGPAPERPRTSAGTRGKDADDDFADEEIGDDLLPE